MEFFQPVKRISLYFRFVTAALLLVTLTGCSMLLALNVPKDTSYVIKTGSKRADIVAVLGKPAKSTALSPPRPAPALPDGWPSARVSLCDEYKVSGLLLTPNEAGTYQNQWNIYPVCLLFTAGATEAIALPATAGDLTRIFHPRSKKEAKSLR